MIKNVVVDHNVQLRERKIRPANDCPVQGYVSKENDVGATPDKKVDTMGESDVYQCT